MYLPLSQSDQFFCSTGLPSLSELPTSMHLPNVISLSAPMVSYHYQLPATCKSLPICVTMCSVILCLWFPITTRIIYKPAHLHYNAILFFSRSESDHTHHSDCSKLTVNIVSLHRVVEREKKPKTKTKTLTLKFINTAAQEYLSASEPETLENRSGNLAERIGACQITSELK